MRGRGDYLGLRQQQIACVLPGGGHTVEALARVAAEAQQRAGSLRSMQAAWQACPPIPEPYPLAGLPASRWGSLAGVRCIIIPQTLTRCLHTTEAAWQARLPDRGRRA